MDEKSRAFLDTIQMRDIERVRTLLGEGIDVHTREDLPWEHGEPAVMLAVLFDKTGEIIQLLLERGAEVDARCTRYGRTSLMWKVHPLLLQNGADVNAVDDEGESVLQHAIDRSDVEEVKLLLEHHATVTRDQLDAALFSYDSSYHLGYKEIAGLLEKALEKQQ